MSETEFVVTNGETIWIDRDQWEHYRSNPGKLQGHYFIAHFATIKLHI